MFMDPDFTEFSANEIMSYRARRATRIVKDYLVAKPGTSIKIFNQYFTYQDGEVVEVDATKVFFTEAAVASAIKAGLNQEWGVFLHDLELVLMEADTPEDVDELVEVSCLKDVFKHISETLHEETAIKEAPLEEFKTKVEEEKSMIADKLEK